MKCIAQRLFKRRNLVEVLTKTAHPGGFVLSARGNFTVINRGQALSEKLGTQITGTYSYTAATGQMASAVYTTPSITIRQLAYQYDVFGNVLQQSLAGGGTTENYAYDQMQRLKTATRAGGASGTVSYEYDAAGNFTQKSDFSTTASNAYTYTGGACGGGPNAVKSVAMAAGQGGGTRNYCYDANGNLTSDSMSGGTAGSFFAKYDHDNLPYYTSRSATLATRTASITYDADGGRVRQMGTDGTRLYDGAYEKVLSPSIEEKVYVGDYAVLTKPSGGTTRVNYLLKDRLGSVDTVTDANGAIAEQRGYDAYGKPRQGSWADLSPPRLSNIANTPRGFTQHEHLNSVELIHMNGRAYDYNLGRFLSVDPIIKFPTNSQSLNPYSYIMNNPLSGTDPTGFSMSCGVNPKGLDEGQSTTCTVKTKDVGSNITTTTKFTATKQEDGSVAFSQAGNSSSNGGANITGLTATGKADGASKGSNNIAPGGTERERMRFGLTVAKDGISTMGSALDPCPSSSSAGGCATEMGRNAVVVYGASKALRFGKDVVERGLDTLSQKQLGDKAGREGLSEVVKRYWTPSEFKGVKVYQRDDLIDPAMTNGQGQTNLQLMRMGRAPLGPDGRPINLHHTIQSNDSPVAEVTATFHRQYSSVLHINPNTMPSGIDRRDFDKFRQEYWMSRANDFE